jgi:hypothetical protein
MGALAQAAPWKGATPAENAAYAQQAELGDADFEREVVQQGGPSLEGHVDADRAHTLNTSGYNVRGIYMPEGEPMSDKEKEHFAPILNEAKISEFEPGNAYALGGHNAKPDIWAHEFDHRRQDVEELSPWLGKEKSATLMQAFRADSQEEWYEAVRVWHAYNQGKFQEKGQTLLDVEEHLKGMLDSWGADLVKIEVDARESRGDRPKDQPGRFWGMDKGDLRKDAEEQAAKRAKSHDLQAFYDRNESEE